MIYVHSDNVGKFYRHGYVKNIFMVGKIYIVENKDRDNKEKENKDLKD